MQVKRAYRFRFYPTPEQVDALARTFGCARFAYNHMLRLRSDAWMLRQERVGYHETSAALTMLKKTPEHAWLNEVSSVPVQQALRHLNTAFSNFFAKRARYPSFKRKDGPQAAEYTTSAFRWDAGRRELRLAKMDTPLDIRWSRTLPKVAKLTTVTISRDTAGRYFAALLCDDVVTSRKAASGQVGIDLGLTHFAVLSSGEKVASPKAFRRCEARLAVRQRRLARAKLGSKNRAKLKLKVAALHAHITDARRDFLHKLSTRLISENQVIAVETLSVSNMQRNRSLAKSISDASWAEFVRQLEYKAQWYGRTLIGIDRWYPSSKRCSVCGHTKTTMPLCVRTWACPECGTTHDRDINAARNVLAAGLAVSAHGEAVSPVSL
ncbi:RNA-guided endonuclease TnpB family protein [Thiomonas sp. FB-Cd]|uniref:RNA-guided endonuclease InsQ/TnpB family protein n=1 Tax=Thiomonas sp. FB-Cd TaxID=1158292 RepID=UPI0004DF821D|nr:RNA-guided endonuclease TnpB family protein [Thiomonas sp. FB-Cd]